MRRRRPVDTRWGRYRQWLYGTFGAGIVAGAVIVLAAPHKFVAH